MTLLLVRVDYGTVIQTNILKKTMKKVENSLKILFITLNQNISSGSYRIWVSDYCKYFNDIGVDSKKIVFQDVTEDILKESDVVILGKCLRQHFQTISSQLKAIKQNLIIGTITPPSDLTSVSFDFAMAGSPEEADSLSFHGDVILNAHIESLYHSSAIKIHGAVDTLKICYHGWTPHLFSFVGGLKSALEDFSKKRNIELNIISEKTEKEINWTSELGRPDIPIVYKRWNIDTIKQDIQSCDMGLCPGVYDLTSNTKDINNKYGKFNTDYIVRYKNKTNNGRALAFMSLGIPVIADFSPSNFHLFGDEQNGFVAHSKDGWARSFSKLSDFNSRNRIAESAKDFTNKNYDPHSWAMRYYNSIVDVTNKVREKNGK